MVEARGRPPREVAVDVEPGQQVAELLRALATHLGVDGDGRLGLYCRRTGGWLEGEREIASTGLRTGDRVDLWDRSGTPPGWTHDARQVAAVDLLVVGGPDAGRRVPLPPGEHRLGSSRYASILLADPSLSKVHLLITVSPWGAVTIADPGTENGSFVGGGRIAGPTPVETGQLVVSGRSLLAFQRPAAAAAAGQAVTQDRTGHLVFNRPPRVALTRPEGEFEAPAPPERQRGTGLPLGSAAVMLLMGGVMYFALGRQTYMLVFFLLSPLFYLGTWLDGAVGGGWRFRRQARRYRELLQRLDGQMAAAAKAEADYLGAEAPDAVTLVERARRLEAGLWDRRPDSPDWLVLRVGWWDRPSSISVKLEEQGDAGLRLEARRLAERHRWLRTVPMTVSVRDAGVVGLSGGQAIVAAIARWTCLQLATLHSPQELVLAAVVPEAEREDWAWLGWLPHLHSDAAPMPGPLIASDRGAAYGLVERLLAVLEERGGGREPAARVDPSIVVLIREGVALPRGAVAELLQHGPAAGIYTIWVGAHGNALPGECGAVVEAEAQGLEPVVTLPGRGASSRGGGPDGVSVPMATDAALALAPVRDVSSRQRQAGVPARVQLLELLGAQDDPEGTLLGAWIRDRSKPAERELSALWGVAAGGSAFDVSLRYDGPHALVGGMTGSGKSELLQSLVAALSARHSPRTLNFLLVDYKGGAAFKDCVDLPHTVGFVTDLDGHLVNRALVSLRAELRRREEVLRRTGAKDLLELEQLHPEEAPASLVIVVDEFAALATELPEFVEGMIDVAQRGRSLGIHLVLATQRPAGVINDKIRANTNLRISLRFSDEGESADVIGTPDAARPGLPPGRAFARVGPGQVTEFQAGYVGGRTTGSRGPAPVLVRDLSFGNAASAAGQRRVARGEGATDLQNLVAAAVQVNRRLGLPPPPRPWLPTLPEVLPLEGLPAPGRSAGGAPGGMLGLVDDPAGQRQYPLELRLDEDVGLMVFGASGSGKTVVLRSLAASLARATSPAELHLYAIDFASRGLKPLEALPHCGAVIVGDEAERAVRLLTMLRAEAERRKHALAQTGTTTIDEHRAVALGEPLPRVLVLLDGVAGFASAFEDVGPQHLETLLQLVTEGRPLGISFVFSAGRAAGLAARLGAGIGRRLVLRMASEDEYLMIGVPRSVYAGASLPPGRGFTERHLEVQCAVLGSDASGSAQAAAVQRLGAELRARGPAVDVPKVGVLPTDLSRSSLPLPAAALEAVIGLGDAWLEPARVDLAEGHFVITGPRRSGRTAALAAFAASLADAPGGPALHLLAAHPPSPLATLDVWTSTALGVDACAGEARRLADAARSGVRGGGRATVLVVDDGDELPAEAEDLTWIAERGRDHRLCIVAAVPNHVAQRAYGGWLVSLLRDRQGLLLDPDTAMDGPVLGVRLPARRAGVWPPGRGFLVRRGQAELVQVARAAPPA
jgi:DNA segregation ATPase FtsK/SpoIIIE, S-DNA-T family